MANNISEAESFINHVYADRAKNDSNSTSLAFTLESNIETVFSSPDKFIFELLQNADDANAENIQLNLIGNDLIISHDGAIFNDEDVIRVCDNAKPSGTKSSDINKTGYKGVGFKAVFCAS